ncbi:hypothetical protein [Dasania marina]|uniref:hypothetical protein n=1 Tax=Dasania marina TaxID=471499 RepID=UPI0030D82773
MFRHLTFILCLFATASINANELQLPCWFNGASANAGAMGMARSLAVTDREPILRSRYRALQGLAAYIDTDAAFNQTYPSWRDIPIDAQSLNVSGQAVYFADGFEWQGYRYSYAQVGEPVSADQCPVQQCDLNACDPDWLCQPGIGGQAAFLGVSYRADTLPAQYRAALNNAIDQLAPVYGLTIRAKDRIYTGQISSGAIRLMFSDEQLTAQTQLDSSRLRYRTIASCRLGEQLFQRIEFPDLATLSTVPAQQWLRQPTAAGQLGAIGSVHGRVASGLISDKLKLAIRRGLIELAKAKYSHVEETLWNIEQQGSSYQLSLLTQRSEVQLSARVNGVHFSASNDDVAVDVWVVETAQIPVAEKLAAGG